MSLSNCKAAAPVLVGWVPEAGHPLRAVQGILQVRRNERQSARGTRPEERSQQTGAFQKSARWYRMLAVEYPAHRRVRSSGKASPYQVRQFLAPARVALSSQICAPQQLPPASVPQAPHTINPEGGAARKRRLNHSIVRMTDPTGPSPVSSHFRHWSPTSDPAPSGLGLGEGPVTAGSEHLRAGSPRRMTTFRLGGRREVA